MFSVDSLMSIEKTDLEKASISIEKSDLPQLVEWLSEKDDKIRYQSLLILQNRSRHSDDVYPFWEQFKKKLKSENSYQRSIGLMLIADNVRWDKENKINDMIDDYLNLLKDEKPITVRQCIQSFHSVISYKKNLCPKIAENLMAIRISDIRETMRKSILLDILGVLAEIRKENPSDEIENYISHSLTGGILDQKSKKDIGKIL